MYDTYSMRMPFGPPSDSSSGYRKVAQAQTDLHIEVTRVATHEQFGSNSCVIPACCGKYAFVLYSTAWCNNELFVNDFDSMIYGICYSEAATAKLKRDIRGFTKPEALDVV